VIDDRVADGRPGRRRSAGRSFIGCLVGTYVDLQDLMTLTAQGKVTLHTSTYPLDAINDAMADLDNGRLQGRGILVPEGVREGAAAAA